MGNYNTKQQTIDRALFLSLPFFMVASQTEMNFPIYNLFCACIQFQEPRKTREESNVILMTGEHQFMLNHIKKDQQHIHLISNQRNYLYDINLVIDASDGYLGQITG